MSPLSVASVRWLPLVATATGVGVALYVGVAGLALWAAVRWARQALETPTDATPPGRG